MQQNDSTGFAANLFVGADEKVLAIRGTEFEDSLPQLVLALLPGQQLSEQTVLDLFGADLEEIVGLGLAIGQSIGLVNYILRATTPTGASVAQYTLRTQVVVGGLGGSPAPLGAPSFRLANLGPVPSSTWYWLEASSSTGTGLLSPGERITVVGHSLGGHLAALALRLFPALFSQAVVFNAAGFDALGSRAVTEAFVRMLTPLLPAAPAADFASFGERLQNFASESSTHDDDLSIVPSALTGIGRLPPVQRLRTESNSHGMDPLMDSVAVLALLEQLMPDAPRETLFTLFDAASATPGDSAERLIGSLAELLLPAPAALPNAAAGWLGYPLGEESFAARSALHDAVLALESALASRPDLRLVPLWELDDETLAARVQASIAYRYALREYLPFALTGDDALYARLDANGALTTEAMSAAEIADRVRIYRYEISRRRVDGPAASVIGTPPTDYADLRHGLRFVALDLLPDTQPPIDDRVVIGTEGADSGPGIAGSARRDRLYGGDGNDELRGGGARDYLDGGRHDDVLEGGAGADVLDGGEGDDTLYGASATEADDGDSDLLIGGPGFDRLFAASGDVVVDRDGELRVRVGEAWVLATGRSYRLLVDDGVVRVLQSDDALALTLAYNRGTRELRVGGVTVLDFTPGDLGITLAAGFAPDPNPPRLTGTPGDDRLIGTAIAEYLSGGAGNDELYGNGGDDRLFGEAGRDALDGGDGDDLLDGGVERDSLLGGAGSDTLRGGDGSDALAGGPGDDMLDGGDDDDVLGGGLGRDVLVGGAGDDLLSAELDFARPDADWIVERRGTTLGTILRDPRAIRLFGFNALELSALNRPRDTAGDVLYGGEGNDLLFGSAGIDTIDGGPGDDTALGGDGTDVMFGGEGADHLRGGGGADLIFGGAGDDFLTGYGSGNEGIEPDGDDRLDGGDGNDELQGGAGDDELLGGTGDDRLFGDDGDDLLRGQAGNDMLAGGAGRDELHGDEGDDRLFGEGDDDALWGGDGDDYLDGGDGNDRLSGGAGADSLLGGDGDDVLAGGAGRDDLVGGAGNDTLNGGIGNDRLDGGAGHDLYRLDDLPGHDLIVDTSGVDELHLTELHSLAALKVETQGEDLTLAWAADRSVRIAAWRSGTIDRLRIGEDLVLDGAHLDDLRQAGRVRSLSSRLATSPGAPFGTGGDDDLILDASAPSVSAGAGDDRYLVLADAQGLKLRIDDTDGDNTLQFRGSLRPQDLTLALDGEAYVLGFGDNRLTLDPHAIARYAFADGTMLDAGDFRLRVLNTVAVAPRLAQALENRAVYLGQSFSFALPAASFVDLNPGTVLAFEAALANGNPLPSWLRFDADTRRFTGTAPAGTLGSYAVRVKVTDPGGLTAEDVFGLDVLPTLHRAPGAVFGWQGVNGVNGFWIVTPETEGTTRAAPMIAAVGDLNADGYDDFLVGDTVRFGRARGFGAALAPASLDGYDAFRIDNYVAEGFRYADSGLHPVRGDFNGDGIDDILLPSRIGDPADDRVLYGHRGRFASVVDRQSLPALVRPPAATPPPLVYEGQLVVTPAVRRLGDFNGDGREDWLVTVSGDTASRDWHGVVFGSATAAPVVLDAPNGRNALRLHVDAYPGYPYTEPDGALEASGWGPLLPLGDVNDDGRADLGIGSAPYLFMTHPTYAAVVFGRSDGYGGHLALSALNGGNGFMTTFPSPGSAYSAAHLLREAGDLNGDGFDDFFAVDDANGAVYAIYGRVAFSGAMQAGTAASEVVHAPPNAVTHAGPGDDTIYVPMSAPGLVFGGSGRNAMLFVPGGALPAGSRVFHVDAFGGLQEDTYHVIANTGLAIIHLHDPAGAPNRLVLGWSLATFEFLVRQGSVMLDFGPQAPQIHLEDVDLDDVLGGPRTVQTLEFAGGEIITYEDLIARGFDVPGTDFDEALRGSDVIDRIMALGGDDLLVGGRGDDLLDGGAGGDTYVQSIGDGRDAIRDASGADRIRFGEGLTLERLRWRHEARDLVIAYGQGDELRLTDWHVRRSARIETFEFATGEEASIEQLVNRAPTVKVNPQTLWLDAGKPFRFTLPTNWFGDADPLDRLTYRLLPDAAAGTASLPSWLRVDGKSRAISGTAPAGYAGEIRLSLSAFDPLRAEATLPLRLAFGTGVSRTGTARADSLAGTSWSDRLSGLAGNDKLHGAGGNDVLDGGAGNDFLHGGSGNDRLRGGPGNDYLDGGPGDDVYVVTRGTGVDRIANADASGFDELLFEDPAIPADFWFSRQGEHLSISRSGTFDRVDLLGWYATTPARLDRVNLDDRYTLVAADVDRLVEAMAQFGPTPAPGSAFAPLIANALAPVLAAAWKPMA